MVRKEILNSLVLATQENVTTPEGVRTIVTLLSRAMETLKQDVFLAHLQDTAAPVTPEDIATFVSLQSRLTGSPDYALTLEDKEFISRVRAAMVNWLSDDPPAEQPEKKKMILIVEDEPHIREAMAKFVAREFGGHVVTAATGTQGLTLFREHRPGLVLLDVSLPDIDGLQILGDMKGMDPAVRVYFVTGISGEAFSKQAVEQGAAGYVPKPVDMATLSAIVKSY